MECELNQMNWIYPGGSNWIEISRSDRETLIIRQPCFLKVCSEKPLLPDPIKSFFSKFNRNFI